MADIQDELALINRLSENADARHRGADSVATEAIASALIEQPAIEDAPPAKRQRRSRKKQT